MLYNKPVRLGL